MILSIKKQNHVREGDTRLGLVRTLSLLSLIYRHFHFSKQADRNSCLRSFGTVMECGVVGKEGGCERVSVVGKESFDGEWKR